MSPVAQYAGPHVPQRQQARDADSPPLALYSQSPHRATTAHARGMRFSSVAHGPTLSRAAESLARRDLAPGRQRRLVSPTPRFSTASTSASPRRTRPGSWRPHAGSRSAPAIAHEAAAAAVRKEHARSAIGLPRRGSRRLGRASRPREQPVPDRSRCTSVCQEAPTDSKVLSALSRQPRSPLPLRGGVGRVHACGPGRAAHLKMPNVAGPAECGLCAGQAGGSTPGLFSRCAIKRPT